MRQQTTVAAELRAGHSGTHLGLGTLVDVLFLSPLLVEHACELGSVDVADLPEKYRPGVRNVSAIGRRSTADARRS